MAALQQISANWRRQQTIQTSADWRSTQYPRDVFASTFGIRRTASERLCPPPPLNFAYNRTQTASGQCNSDAPTHRYAHTHKFSRPVTGPMTTMLRSISHAPRGHGSSYLYSAQRQSDMIDRAIITLDRVTAPSSDNLAESWNARARVTKRVGNCRTSRRRRCRRRRISSSSQAVTAAGNAARS
jgi:hypothetical protein